MFNKVLVASKDARPFRLQKLMNLLLAFKILKKVLNKLKEGAKPQPRYIASKALMNRIEFGVNIQGVTW